MKLTIRFLGAATCASLLVFPVFRLSAQDSHFHIAPASSAQMKNPYAGDRAAVVAGSKLYTRNCGSCHGIGGRGSGNVPPLSRGPAQTAPDGEVFWFITTGSKDNGMPSWAQLPEEQRWQLVSYIKSLKTAATTKTATSLPSDYKPTKVSAPAPAGPFTDFRFEKPGKTRKITADSLPSPYATASADNGPQLVKRPQGA
ncbi:MAG TPA: c-type cytochrome, partial [Terriglobales bacterium]|nr:c-type cytochrome [Terriglobales bacterium]